MSQDQPFIWKTLLGGPIIWVGWSPGDLQGGPDSVCQVDGVSDMTPTCQLCSFEEEGSEMRQRPPPTFLSRRKLSPGSCFDGRHFSSSLYATGAFQAVILLLELRASESE